MTDRFNDSEELQSFLKTLIKHIPVAVFIVDENFVIHAFNDADSILLNNEERWILGQLFGNSVGCINAVEEKKDCGLTSKCSSCELRKSMLQSFLNEGQSVRTMAKRTFVRDGNSIEKYFYFTCEKIIYQKRNMSLIVIDDVTGLELKNQELAALNEKKNEFIGMAFHDLMNPISIVKMFCSGLKEDLGSCLDQRNKKALEQVDSMCRFMIGILENLLSLSQIESGKLSLRTGEVDYPALLDEIVDIMMILAKPKAIDIVIVPSGPLPPMNGDHQRLIQVLNNLLGNAIKYAPSGSRVTIRLVDEGKAIRTEIIDQGPGIPENEQQGLFHPFYVTSVQASGGERSTGLGLAIVKRIIEGHGGRVGVVSAVGRGSNFWFTLPLNK